MVQIKQKDSSYIFTYVICLFTDSFSHSVNSYSALVACQVLGQVYEKEKQVSLRKLMIWWGDQHLSVVENGQRSLQKVLEEH